MTILLLGKNGQVGWELQRALAPLGALAALDRQGRAAQAGLPALCGDLNDPAALAQTVRALKPRVVVNAAAHTAVDKAEAEPELAQRLNADAPAALAAACAEVGAALVHYSTDYVFDGSGELPWSEGDATGPLSVYGRTKLAGEDAIRASGCAHLIVRTSWVYAARGGNFAKTMLRLAGEREHLTIVADQIGAPTGAELIADVTAQALPQLLADAGKSGTYHLAASGATSWFDYAQFVFATAQQVQPGLALAVKAVEAVPSSAFATAATRPHNSRLNCARLRTTFGLRLPPWQDGVTRMLTEHLMR
ncbi:dTDP-4-dehydrorhamnose reductase [Comamonas serinivorans]|uniref:dTDP-4-dehydrorhamnose reductase n=1 Tax=Comamonas serinivorans TaxID=1082851 RepID=A0A1Y0ESG0_9BURK|nr:dTDP-4-dehydrorhamnose reductase [Comamonas serinivorans]ARU06311.1 dTDP-4-dehydrorhamnose reductase [Comamonas serinivorans]